jgi:glycosyltransferase involved in cell wall biosynthesis
LLAVGNLKTQKDYPNLLHAVKILKNRGYKFSLKIAGDGPEYSSIMSLINELDLGSSVSLLGSVGDVSALYHECDVYVLSSAWEGFGNTLVEALSFGCRIVSTKCESGPSEILDEGRYGTLVNPKSPESLAEGIISALHKSPNLTELRNRAEIYSIRRIGRKYESLISN